MTCTTVQPLVARYAGTCAACDMPIQVGEKIDRHEGRWTHTACPDSQASPAVETFTFAQLEAHTSGLSGRERLARFHALPYRARAAAWTALATELEQLADTRCA